MSSANKTSNLQLNQWSRADPVNVDDFNADNAKIDAAASPMVKLMDVTVNTETMTVELDLSGIDLSRYLSLRVYQISSELRYLSLRMNKLTAGYFTRYINAWTDSSSNFFSEGTYADVFLNGYTVYVSNDYSSCKMYGNSYQFLVPRDLVTIDMTGAVSGTDIPVGTRYILMGVKK